MRVLPAVRVEGRIAREVLEVPTNLKRPLIAIIATAGRQIACTFDPLIFCPEIIELEKRARDINLQGRERAFLQ